MLFAFPPVSLNGQSVHAARFKATTPKTTACPSTSSQPLPSIPVPLETSQAYLAGQIRFGEKPGVDAILKKLSKNIDQAKDWSYEMTFEGLRLWFSVGNTQYTLTSLDTENPDGEETPITQHKLSVKNPHQSKSTAYPLDEQSFQSLFQKLEKVFAPKLEAQYGLAPGMNTTPVIMKATEQLLNGDVQSWNEGEENLNAFFLSIDVLPRAGWIGGGRLQDGTILDILQDSESPQETEEAYLSLMKGPGRPVFKLRNGQEFDALTLLSHTRLLLQTEKDLKELSEDPNLASEDPELASRLPDIQVKLEQKRASLLNAVAAYKAGSD
jgi:hypothetical protein